MPSVISLRLATMLQAAGLAWTPQAGDRFAIDQPDMADDRFVLSNMTIESHEHATGRMMAFHGTTEWALDAIEQQHTVWIPAEDQVRDRLGDRFRRLERTADGFRVLVEVEGQEIAYDDADPAEAYGKALLHLLTR